jgi:ABC-2 type transport system ATP-binding protein
MSEVVRTDALSKRYGRTTAVRSLDLVVHRGSIFGYLGPNGAGKTTTIRMLVGLLRPTSGSATVLGHDVVRDRDEMQRRVGYLPGAFVAYPDLTAWEYLRFLGHLRGGIDETRVAGLAGRLSLDLDRHIGTMSHGNKQKVGIVQALAHDPELVVLDEPTSGLDPLVQREFLEILREHRDAGTTVLLSSHVLSEVEAVADEVAILRDGALVVVEAVDRLKARAQRRVDLLLEHDGAVATLLRTPGVHRVDGTGRRLQVSVEGSMAALFSAAAPYGIERAVTHEPGLEEIFLGYYEQHHEHEEVVR